MSSFRYAAVALKNTRHVLGVLSRDADPDGGSDLTLLVPESLTVRAPRENDAAAVPPKPPVEIQVPASKLQAIVINTSKEALRQQVFSNPHDCVVAEDGSCAPRGSGAAAPTVSLVAPAPGTTSITAFNLVGVNNTGASAVPFTVLIQQAAPAPGQEPFSRIIEGKVAAGASGATGVLITLVPSDDSPVADPIPKGTPLFVLTAVAGRPLGVTYEPNP